LSSNGIPAKATANFGQHAVTFEEALTVFMDPLARIHEDPDHSEGEQREIIVGHSIEQRLLLVSFAEGAWKGTTDQRETCDKERASRL